MKAGGVLILQHKYRSEIISLKHGGYRDILSHCIQLIITCECVSLMQSQEPVRSVPEGLLPTATSAMDDDKLLKTASKHYIELAAVISREGITHKEADEFTKKSHHALTEEILCKKSY